MTLPSLPHLLISLAQLLGELLLDRSNVKVMVRFVSEAQHLMQMMMMLKDSSRSIQFEAFHVFKVRRGLEGLFACRQVGCQGRRGQL